MSNINLYVLALLGACSLDVMAAKSDAKLQNEVRLYQIGRNGNYCLSTTKDESGCISGSDKDGVPVNVLDIIKGKNVVFENLSDAPHDMHFTGANAGDIPPQFPGAPDAIKNMGSEDMQKQKITCSFHGDQLGVGYRVPDVKKGSAGNNEGHKERNADGSLADGGQPRGGAGGAGGAGGRGGRGAVAGGGEGGGAAAGGVGDTTNVDAPQPLIRTGLADVSDQVLAKGSPADVKKLLDARPELKAKLEQIRPLLAAELAAAGSGGGDSAGGGSSSRSGGAVAVGGNTTLPTNVVAASGGDGAGRLGAGGAGAGTPGKGGKLGAAEGALGTLEKGFGSLSQALGVGHGADAKGRAGAPIASARGARGVAGVAGAATDGNGATDDPTKLAQVELASVESQNPIMHHLNWILLGVGAVLMLAAGRKLKTERARKG